MAVVHSSSEAYRIQAEQARLTMEEARIWYKALGMEDCPCCGQGWTSEASEVSEASEASEVSEATRCRSNSSKQIATSTQAEDAKSLTAAQYYWKYNKMDFFLNLIFPLY